MKKMFSSIKNKRVKNEAIEVYKYFLADTATRRVVNEINPRINYDSLVYTTVEDIFYCCGSVDGFNPYIDKRYLDISWLQVGKKIINLDDIYHCIVDDAKELNREGI